MTLLERQKVSQLEEHLKMSVRFQCCACYIAKPIKEALGVFVWKPRSKMMARAAQHRVAVYVLCTECGRKPETETHPKIESHLAKNGLFG